MLPITVLMASHSGVGTARGAAEEAAEYAALSQAPKASAASTVEGVEE
jgi:hypothetical protein